MKYKVGLRLISISSKETSKGEIISDTTFINNIKSNNIIINFNGKLLLYTKSMLDECFEKDFIKIDKEYYRNEKLNQLGIYD